MLQDQIRLMLESFKKDRKAFKSLCKKGYFSYSDETSTFVGEAAIVNSKALISLVKDQRDESQIIATMTFTNGYSQVIKISGKDFSQIRFGTPRHNGDIGAFLAAKVYSLGRDSATRDISSIVKYCSEAKEKSSSASSKSLITKLMDTFSSSNTGLSKEEVKVLIEKTLDNLYKAKRLSIRESISPLVNPSAVSNADSINRNDSISHDITDTSR